MRRFLLFLFTLTAASNATAQVAGNCQPGTISVDGDASEWTINWIEDPDKKFAYNVCADDKNLYVRVIAADENVKRKIAAFGFTLWMDPNGKKKKKLGLRFPTGTEARERMHAMGQGTDHEKMSTAERTEFQKKMLKEMVSDLEVIELIGLADEPLTSSRSGITNGLQVAIAVDDEGRLVYEALIPFKSYRLSKASIPVLAVGFETGKFTPATKSGGGGAGAPGSGYGGGGGHHGGGRHGGGYRGQSQAGTYNEMSSSTNLWVSVNLK